MGGKRNALICESHLDPFRTGAVEPEAKCLSNSRAAQSSPFVLNVCLVNEATSGARLGKATALSCS